MLRDLQKPWAVVSLKHDSISPIELPVFAKLLELPDVEHIIFNIRAMCFSVLVYGWTYKVGDYQDMEDCYADLVRQLTRTRTRRGLGETAVAPTVVPEARAWQGRIHWVNRLKPQAWEDGESAGSHVGGLRDVTSAINKVPGMRQRGLVLGQALDELFTKDPDV